MKFFSKIPSSLNGLMLVMGIMAPLLMIGAAANPALIGLYTTIYIAISAVAGLGMFLFDRSKKAKADDFTKSVETNAASAEGVKDPQRIAQMDHMRKEFQRGIDIYKHHGKDLYSLPWYVVVGESESGKTEMLRRSEIGFPDKLQDRWQGAGGTLSMHWWFTNKAVILDTAGRLFVNEGEAAASRAQWANFLQMLKKNRPDCPINGLLLVIPSNRLLTHPNPEIEAARLAELDKNAGQIASQMETLQSELGIRFPVYIVITKMDKLNGFREFFAKIESPEERYQMLGWSNPAPLGAGFDPQSVADYMASVADRLNRRMMSELRQVAPEDPNGLRINEVDALFAFPTVFESMTGKLTRYLRHIFTTDEWSTKPPFLRGIYLTSALQQGAVLDEALAAAMGVPMEQMDRGAEDDGLSLSRNRTYFVRDLFLDKIFNEKGLVTTAGKIKSAISGWKLWVPALALAVIVLFGTLGLITLRKNDEARLWRALWASDLGKQEHRIPPLATIKAGKVQAARPEDAARLLATLNTLGPMVKRAPQFGWAFKPAQTFDKGLTQVRRELYVDITAETLAKLENAVLESLLAKREESGAWEAGDWSALQALVILRHATKWDAAKKAVVFTSDADQPVSHQLERLLSELMEFAGLRPATGLKTPPARLLAQSLLHAAELPGDLLPAKLRRHREAGAASDQAILNGIFPASSLLDQQQRVAEFNRFADDVLKCASYDRETVRKLAERAGQLKAPADAAAPGDPAIAAAAELATTRDALLGFILAHRELRTKYGYNDLPDDALKAASMALIANGGSLLEEVRETLSLIRPDSPARLDLNRIDTFTRATKSAAEPSDSEAPDAKERAKAADRIRANLSALRRDWFKLEFFPNQFYRYLRSPIITGAPQGTNEDFLLLWKLCETAGQWKIETDRTRRLIAVFHCFFDTTGIKDGVMPLRECEIMIKHTGTSMHQIMAGTKKVGDFPLMAPDLKPGKFYLNEALTFTVDGRPDGQTEPWEMVAKIQIDGQYPWRYIAKSGAAFDISVPNFNLKEALKDWPSMDDFKPKDTP